MDVSIILVTHNSEKYISNCLNSLAKAIQNIDHEIFIIDNQSMDQTKMLIKECGNSVILIENNENIGFAKAVNIGLRKSSGEFILLINPDIIVNSDSLLPLIDFMRNNPKIGICGIRLENVGGSLQYSKGSFPTLSSTIFRMFLPRPMRKYHLWGYNKEGKCDWVTGSFMLTRKCIMEELGGLDEKYFVYYEDVDYCLQTQKGGWLIYYFPEITACHLNPHAISKRSLPIENEIRKSRLYYFKKNNSIISYSILRTLTWMPKA
jgi:GT2 family glycosyltransferase